MCRFDVTLSQHKPLTFLSLPPPTVSVLILLFPRLFVFTLSDKHLVKQARNLSTSAGKLLQLKP